ncbi:lipoprotein signal peptidase [Desulfuromonas versatilis]|uniref:Lipoprotein signal peptidase n=1 Tax=Desulfuromonas versatilis TaxID=2802975 RepID=A0ABN6E2K7_9BACT|nr:lipoprotein signal peptidase [Desulfuromonas versatilis]
MLFACVGCDQTTKTIARKTLAGSEPISFLSDVFRLQYAENPGAFLGLGAGTPDHLRYWVFTVFVGILLVGLLTYLIASKNMAMAGVVGISLVFSGGIGNLIDRICNDGRVIDFMNMGIGPLRTGVFNVADIAISAGCVMVLALSVKKQRGNVQH